MNDALLHIFPPTVTRSHFQKCQMKEHKEGNEIIKNKAYLQIFHVHKILIFILKLEIINKLFQKLYKLRESGLNSYGNRQTIVQKSHKLE